MTRPGLVARTRSMFGLLYDAANAWIDDRAMRLGAGVAYYALFALVPVLMLAISVASVFLGESVSADVQDALAELLGAESAAALLELTQQIGLDANATVVPVISAAVLIFTATLLFVAWKEVVDLIWKIPRVRGIRASLRRRGFALLAVIGAGALLTVVLIAEAVLAFVDTFLAQRVLDVVVKATSSFVPAAIGAVFIGVLFRYTPDTRVAWRSVWLASIVSMVMLAVGAWGYGLYLDRFGVHSAAGVAGTLFLGLVLVYYASLILLYGMEIVRLKHQGEEERAR